MTKAKEATATPSADIVILPPVTAKFKIKSCTLRTLIDVLKLAELPALNIEPAGISSRVTDAAHVAQAHINLASGAFEQFECSSSGIFSIDLDILEEFIKLGKGDDIVSMKVNKSSVSVAVGNLTRRIPLETYSSSPKALNLKAAASVSIAVEEMTRSLKACALVTDHLRMVIRPDAFVMVSSGDGENEVACRFPKELLASLTVKEPQAAQYPLDYVTNAVHAIPVGSVIKVEFSNDLPLQISAECAAGKGYIWFGLAPRIDTDEPTSSETRDDEGEEEE